MTKKYEEHERQLTQVSKIYSNLPLVKSAKNSFPISQPKHMLWVLKRTVSMKLFFWAPKTWVKTDG